MTTWNVIKWASYIYIYDHIWKCFSLMLSTNFYHQVAAVENAYVLETRIINMSSQYKLTTWNVIVMCASCTQFYVHIWRYFHSLLLIGSWKRLTTENVIVMCFLFLKLCPYMVIFSLFASYWLLELIYVIRNWHDVLFYAQWDQ